MARSISDYWDAIEPYWDIINIYGEPLEFLEQFSMCPNWIGHLFAAHWCNSEISNGGLHQFFHNSTGILAPEAVEGFRAIGLEPLAAIVARAVEKFGDPYPRCREDRMTFLDKVKPERPNSEDSDLFEALDDMYFDTYENLGIHQKMDEYARMNSG